MSQDGPGTVFRVLRPAKVQQAPSLSSPLFFVAAVGRIVKQFGHTVVLADGTSRVPITPRGWVNLDDLELAFGKEDTSHVQSGALQKAGENSYPSSDYKTEALQTNGKHSGADSWKDWNNDGGSSSTWSNDAQRWYASSDDTSWQQKRESPNGSKFNVADLCDDRNISSKPDPKPSKSIVDELADDRNTSRKPLETEVATRGAKGGDWDWNSHRGSWNQKEGSNAWRWKDDDVRWQANKWGDSSSHTREGEGERSSSVQLAHGSAESNGSKNWKADAESWYDQNSTRVQEEFEQATPAALGNGGPESDDSKDWKAAGGSWSDWNDSSVHGQDNAEQSTSVKSEHVGSEVHASNQWKGESDSWYESKDIEYEGHAAGKADGDSWRDWKHETDQPTRAEFENKASDGLENSTADGDSWHNGTNSDDKPAELQKSTTQNSPESSNEAKTFALDRERNDRRIRYDTEVRAAPSLTSAVLYQCNAGKIVRQMGKPVVLDSGVSRVPLHPRGWINEDALEPGADDWQADREDWRDRKQNVANSSGHVRLNKDESTPAALEHGASESYDSKDWKANANSWSDWTYNAARSSVGAQEKVEQSKFEHGASDSYGPEDLKASASAGERVCSEMEAKCAQPSDLTPQDPTTEMEMQTADNNASIDVSPKAGISLSLALLNNELEIHLSRHSLIDRSCPHAATRILLVMSGILRKLGTSGKIELFGSASTGLKTDSSDMDIAFNDDIEKDNVVPLLSNFAAALATSGFNNITRILQSSIPIIKCMDAKSGMEVDFCIANRLGVRNSLLLDTYCRYDSRVVQLGRLVKDWAKRHELVGTADGCINSYAYMLLIIHFLQSLDPPVVPNLQVLGTHRDSVPVTDNKWGTMDTWETKFLEDFSSISSSWNKQSLAELLVDFFWFYTRIFDWSQHAVCMRLARPGIAIDKFTLVSPTRAEQWYIEDPFDLKHNLAGRCSEAGRSRILRAMEEANIHLMNGSWLACLPKAPSSYFLKCRISKSVTPESLLSHFKEFELHKLHFPSDWSGPAILEFVSTVARRHAHTVNESYVEDCQLHLHYCSSHSLMEAAEHGITSYLSDGSPCATLDYGEHAQNSNFLRGYGTEFQ